MYQKCFLRHNGERKDNIFDMQFPLHNITHDKIQKYMIMFFKSFTKDSVIHKNNFSSYCGSNSDSHIFSKFTFQLFMSMY